MENLAQKYPKYYKALPLGVPANAIDVYAINLMFPLNDPTGCLEHARKKLLVPGVRSGGKSMLKDVTEARDTLNRYIALMGAQGGATEHIADVDGWYLHTANGRPKDLPHNAFVQVRLKDGSQPEGRRRAEEWSWTQASESSAITHWRYAP
jgi:hypothetical protein